ncbi:MAG: oligosaccharide flippase family protein [Oscillospiraceae bacterium]|nr:oligosaccharide flippase family protein [Oscillospiraceae bacterium]
MKPSTHSVFYRISILTASGIVLNLLGFAYRIFLGRAAGAEGMGIYQLVLPFYSFLQAVTLSGLTMAVSTLAAEEAAHGSFFGAQIALKRGRRLFLLLFFCIACLTLCCSEFIGEHLLGNAETRNSLLLLLPCLLLTGFENLYKNYFYGIGVSRPPITSELTEQSVRFLAVALLLSLRKPQSPGEICACIVLGMVLSEIVSVVLLSRFFKKVPPTRVHTTRSRLISVAAPLTLSAVANTLLSSLGAVLIPQRLVVFGYSEAQAISEYGVLFGMTIPLLTLPFALLGPLTLVLVPRLAESMVLRNHSDVRRKAGKALHMSGLLACFSTALLIPLANPLSQLLYGQKTAEAFLLPLCLVTFLGFYQLISAAILSGIGKQRAAALHVILGGVVQLGGTWAVGHFGMVGFLVGNLLSTLLIALLNLRTVQSALSLRVPWRNWLVTPTLSGLLSCLCVRAVFLRMIADGLSLLLAILFSAGLGLALYLCALRAQGTSFLRYFHTLIPQQSSSQIPRVPLP